jgi:uncharacterized flavoprotein (TIGR03862 family)
MTGRGFTATVIGGGPAGLMAAEVLARAGVAVDLYEAMPTVGRKLLMAGRGGLNLTHSEPAASFLTRYGPAAPFLTPAIAAFGAEALRQWAEGLGIATFVGSSGRIFPTALKASPLLRAWRRRLDGLGVRVHTRHRWRGFDADRAAIFEAPDGVVVRRADVTILALGGASWPRLGSDGAWAPLLDAQGVGRAPFRPANCGLMINWSTAFGSRWAGTPLKTIALGHAGRVVAGEAMLTNYGIEGGAVYALGRDVCEAAMSEGGAVLELDLKPGLTEVELAGRLARPRRGMSLGNFLRKAAALPPVASALLREVSDSPAWEHPMTLARLLKRLPLRVVGTAPLARAISTSGGIRLDAVNADFMLRCCPGVFAAGEMLDWDAPTGGYLLQACFATGHRAALGALDWLNRRTYSF